MIFQDGPFSLIDFLMESSVSSSEWMESKLAPSADQIEAHFKNLISNSERKTEESEFLEKWIKRQPQGKPVDSDLLALRTLETLILMAIVRFQRDDPEETREPAAFKILEERLMDWSEAAGLIRSLSSDNPQSALMAETSMDVDFNPNAETSTLFTLNPNEFDIYLLFKFKAKGFRRFKEIAEIVADRCGIPVDSDLDDPMAASAAAGIAKDQQQTKHVMTTSNIFCNFNTRLSVVETCETRVPSDQASRKCQSDPPLLALRHRLEIDSVPLLDKFKFFPSSRSHRETAQFRS